MIFDVDGVLIDDSNSYSATIKAVVRHVVHRMYGRPEHLAHVDDGDIRAFKAAGGFNDDWVLSYALAGILLAWPHGEPPDLPAIARESAGRGLEWVRAEHFPDLPLDFALVKQLCLEYFWGADLLAGQMGMPAVHYHGPGFVRQERALVSRDFLDHLRAAGVRRFGIITGRDQIELAVALDTLGWEAGAFDAVITADMIRKPDPRSLYIAMDALRPSHAALYIGDTGDDLLMIRDYRRQYPDGPTCLFAMVMRERRDPESLPADVEITLDRAEDILPLFGQ